MKLNLKKLASKVARAADKAERVAASKEGKIALAVIGAVVLPRLGPATVAKGAKALAKAKAVREVVG